MISFIIFKVQYNYNPSPPTNGRAAMCGIMVTVGCVLVLVVLWPAIVPPAPCVPLAPYPPLQQWETAVLPASLSLVQPIASHVHLAKSRSVWLAMKVTCCRMGSVWWHVMKAGLGQVRSVCPAIPPVLSVHKTQSFTVRSEYSTVYGCLVFS